MSDAEGQDTRGILQKFADSIVGELRKAAKDLYSLEVITAIGKIETNKKKVIKKEAKLTEEGKIEETESEILIDIYEIQETSIVAKTVIELDGDIIMRLPVKDSNGGTVEIDERILELHQENVNLATENWRTLITTLVEISSKLIELFRPSP